MDKLVQKLKSLTNATQQEYDKAILNYAKKEVIQELKKAGISKEELTQEDFDALLEEKIKQSKSFSKGAMAAGGALLFLDFLG